MCGSQDLIMLVKDGGSSLESELSEGLLKSFLVFNISLGYG